jgi:hypothetical protein
MKAITAVNPRVIVIEYNALLPYDCEWVMKYDSDYYWKLYKYWRCVFEVFGKTWEQKGYQLWGTNVAGVNAFFVRDDW